MEGSATTAFTNSSGVGTLVCRVSLGADFACSTLLFFGDGVGELMRVLGGVNGFLHELNHLGVSSSAEDGGSDCSFSFSALSSRSACPQDAETVMSTFVRGLKPSIRRLMGLRFPQAYRRL